MRKSTLSGLLIVGVACGGALCAAPANAVGLPVVSGAESLTSQQKAGVQGLGGADKKSSKAKSYKAKSYKAKSSKGSNYCPPPPPPQCPPPPPPCGS